MLVPIATVGSTWQASMKQAIRSSRGLYEALQLNPDELPFSKKGEREFPVFVPYEFLRRMKPGDTNDPLLLQVVARPEESIDQQGFESDPVGDQHFEKAPGLLHKYQGRVLMIVSGACAIHCRYCFRRHYPYETAPKGLANWEPALDYIRQDSSIHEVILSGGDPLSVADEVLSSLVQTLDSIEHLSRLRIHTRFPVTIPHRVNNALEQWLSATRLSKWIVLHINHPQEIDQALEAAIERLRRCGANVLNQAVLLKGINDTLEIQSQLSKRLVDIGVMPYYLHQLDRVQGASHFEVDQEVGQAIVRGMAERLPGYAVPKYVSEIAGEPSKTRIG